MRKCLRCNTEMIEDLDVKVEGACYGIKVTQQGFFKGNLGKVCCAVCPKCGYMENYIQDISKVKNIENNKEEK